MMKLCRWLLPLLPAFAISQSMAATTKMAGLIGGDLRFTGKVVALPCDVAPGDEKVPVDFKQIALKDLVNDRTTKPIPFTIHLLNCNAVVFESVTISFSGNESPKLPNRLMITPEGAGDMSAIGVGLQLKDGSPVTLKQASPAVALSQGSMSLDFFAFVEADTEEIKSGNVAFGPFTSVAQYTLSYQ
ncbi:fimbrial protein [Pantoea coffeiphila]|uniref:Fimbrial protein n=1 Tax=Pantoea coffeiphila TaxID=1465635 RepID=A0A2S9I7D0_9GAMM|nr:fimbrial protein [Pantoea coffeiphila]PRD13702.1 fimbrial protein [Pantoea coffeiphila]